MVISPELEFYCCATPIIPHHLFLLFKIPHHCIFTWQFHTHLLGPLNKFIN